jgi:hypothetical protein
VRLEDRHGALAHYWRTAVCHDLGEDPHTSQSVVALDNARHMGQCGLIFSRWNLSGQCNLVPVPGNVGNPPFGRLEGMSFGWLIGAR